ncbi:flagellar assembly protein FliH [Aliidiomarina celeris]|uniref:flagellar assembly protein FliH n=1 Tax=Aliidiomarina celeris TaxID=2249428 RepID=UPI000DE905CF|nr:flagellar assembly protein FliH [Aliidiomarina celeris]
MADESSKAWELPDITDTDSGQEQRRNALNMPLRWKYEPPEAEQGSDSESDVTTPLTAEALEQIREAARLEGYEDGRAEGLKVGQEEGFEAGYKEGLQSGTEAGEAQAKQRAEAQQKALAEQWQTRIEGLRHPLAQVDQAVENQLVHMTKALAKAICWQEVKQNDEIVREALKRSLNDLGMTSQKVEIYVHPDDFNAIDTRWDEKVRADKGWFLYSDDSMSRGGCRIQTPIVDIDATMETRMQEVFDSLLQGVKAVPTDALVKPDSAETAEQETPNASSEQDSHELG